MYTKTHNQSYSIKILMILIMSAMIMSFSTLQVLAQDVGGDPTVEEITQEINGLRAQHSALKAQVDAGEITAEEARAEWQIIIDSVRARKKAAFDERIDGIQARYERVYENNPELGERLQERIEAAHERRIEVAENRRVLNQKVHDGEITREEARVIHLEDAQAMQERQEAFQENNPERIGDRLPPPPSDKSTPPPPSDRLIPPPPDSPDSTRTTEPSSTTSSSDNSSTYTDTYGNTITISGGHETDAVDGGRPVYLIGSILGITGEQFQEAFSGVTPEDNGHLTEAATANKIILLTALEQYGIGNDEIDTATNYYRYYLGNAELWPYTHAVINAVVTDRGVTGFEIVSGGDGYTSEPTITVDGYGTISVDITISYSQSFSTNGAITEIELN